MGTNGLDEESAHPFIEALVVREFSGIASSWRSLDTAQRYLDQHRVPVIWDLDTRALVRLLRQEGALRGVVSTDGTAAERLVAEARALPTMAGLDLASRVTCAAGYGWSEGQGDIEHLEAGQAKAQEQESRFHVVAYDYGIKRNILRLLVDHGCSVTVVPAETSAADVLAQKPDGVFLSNGPGDPEPIGYAIGNIRALLGRVPILASASATNSAVSRSAAARTS